MERREFIGLATLAAISKFESVAGEPVTSVFEQAFYATSIASVPPERTVVQHGGSLTATGVNMACEMVEADGTPNIIVIHPSMIHQLESLRYSNLGEAPQLDGMLSPDLRQAVLENVPRIFTMDSLRFADEQNELGQFAP
jgi:hypothetical protein